MIRNFHPSLLRLLRVFHAVAKHKGFTAAETVLNVGQPTISSHIKDLEGRLGFELCERGRSGFRLTSAGERLYESTQRLERELSGFIATVNDIRNELQGCVRIGLTHMLSNVPVLTAVPATMAVLKREFPAVQIEIHLDTPRDIEQGVVDGRYDLAISGFHLDVKNVKVLPMFDMHMYLYCSDQHPLFNVDDSAISDEVLQRYAAVLNVYDVHRQIPFSGMECVMSEASEASLFYVMSGEYIGYLSEFAVVPLVAGGRLRAMRPATYRYSAPGGLLVPDRAADNPAVRKIVELLTQWAPGVTVNVARTADA